MVPGLFCNLREWGNERVQCLERKKVRSHVILSAAKDLCSPTNRVPTPQILRCAQDDIWWQGCNGMHAVKILVATVYFMHLCLRNTCVMLFR
jgi:hypothetical protein